ncbi:DUF4041 domain-containing protein [Actinoplanes sp. L3-i22]|uniref:DUF4041 domain-containing protein n=1 Tax=Actinoplanes sp. L3-i22 TaxID=2836373 RepID=UPI0021034876|nr:DUF4041 domain-containing protein [Actinoplanes sp. L3-i22]
MSIPFDLWGQRGWASAEVAGESHYQAAIRSLFGARLPAGGSEITVAAQLLPEPLNKHDRNAVAVFVGPAQVGYLPRETAMSYAPTLIGLVARGWTPQVGARVWGSQWGPGEFSVSVRLDLAEPHMIMPANQPPPEPHRMLPSGGAIQVTGEQHHLDALATWLRAEGECWVHATLHEITEQSARSARTVVEVRIDGARVGQLTPRMSGEVLAAVRHLAERGLGACTRAIVKGNRIKTEVIVYAARAHELPDSWLDLPSETAPPPAASPAPPAQLAPVPMPRPIPIVPVAAEPSAAETAVLSAPASRPAAPAQPPAPVILPAVPPAPIGQMPPPEPAAQTAVLPAPAGHTTVPITPPAPRGPRAPDVPERQSDPAQAAGPPQAPHRPRFNPPPNWPAPPPGWSPPPGWAPDPGWGPPPAGWQVWIEEPPVEEPRHDPEIPLFGARGKARELAAEVEKLRAEREEMARLGLFDLKDLMEQRQRLQRDLTDLRHHLDGLRKQVVVTEEEALLQEAGIYRYRHPLSDAVAYQEALAHLQDQIKEMAKPDGGAVLAAAGWTVNGSEAQGRTMLRDYAKLMLRAYNAEADNLVRTLKPYKLDAAIERLGKVAGTIARLGKTMDIRISEPYHRLRVQELGLTADHQERLAEEKAREREEKARLREERQLQQEIERERARLDKERQHYANALAALRAGGDVEGAAQLRDRLAEIDAAIQDVDYRAANVRAGYVYVISNLGAFGENMVKVGMTRRLDPLDRVRELGDASVPFVFDVHALFFAEDAVGIEAQMHARLADRRVNLVNQRREFFYATPAEAKRHLMELTGNLLQYEETPAALEYRQSLNQPRRNVVPG